jgi:hypothetical protein
VLARTSWLIHKPSGVRVETPMLVPSFSSKGSQFFKGVSEVGRILETAEAFITKTILISAYDIHHKHLPAPPNLTVKPELFILDSGGYEATEEYDLSAAIKPTSPILPWSAQDLISILDAWPEHLPAMFVSFDHPDHRLPFPQQLDDARQLFNGRSRHLLTFLLKPETKAQRTLDDALNAARAKASEFAGFDAVGLAEKDLGNNAMDRMVNVANLRFAMDEAGVKIPIHIFGGLDPLNICLFFIAGAEIFDGLTWLRYAFDELGRCVYAANHAIVKIGIDVNDTRARARLLSENLYFLQELEQKLRDFRRSKDFTKIPHGDFVKDAVTRLERRLKREVL